MKVLVVHNRYRSENPSGENAVVDDEARLLEEAGCTVERLELSSDEIGSWPLTARAALPLRVVWSREGYRLVGSAIHRTRPSIVHFHNTFPLLSPSALWAARRSGTAVVHTLHNFRPLCPAATFLRAGRVCEDCLGRPPFPAVVHGCYRGSKAATVPIAAMDGVHGALGTWRRCVDVFVLPSEFARGRYIKAGWPAERLAVKYNTTLDRPVKTSAGRAGFACVSRLSREKGVDLLLDAWARAFPTGGETLHVVGSGEEAEALRGRAHGLAGVRFTGALPRGDVLALLARRLALVVPSRSYEVSPRVVVEAFSLGVPVVGPRLGSLPELIEDGCGLLFEPGSAASLAEALQRLAESPELAAQLGRNARRAYETRFSPQRTTGRLLAIYRLAAAGRAA